VKVSVTVVTEGIGYTVNCEPEKRDYYLILHSLCSDYDIIQVKSKLTMKWITNNKWLLLCF